MTTILLFYFVLFEPGSHFVAVVCLLASVDQAGLELSFRRPLPPRFIDKHYRALLSVSFVEVC